GVVGERFSTTTPPPGLTAVQLLPSCRDSSAVHATAPGSVGSTQQWPFPVEHRFASRLPLLQCSVTVCGCSCSTTTRRIHLSDGSASHSWSAASQRRGTTGRPALSHCCWIVCASSCARRLRPARVVGANFPAPKTTCSPTV